MNRRPRTVRQGDGAVPVSRPVVSRPPLTIAKKLCYSATVTIAFFLVLELVLAATGWKPLVRDEDPYVGFLSATPLFVETSGANGAVDLATAANKSRWFNQQRFAKRKPENAYRIFCLGGSTTYGHPYDDATSFAGWLRELLPEVERSRQWEVINAGGISYASYRVAIVMKELLQYDPDLFIVYTGHNEFLEARTYGRLKKTPQIVLLLDRMCSRTRTYAAVSWLVAGDDQSTELRRLRAEKSLLPTEVNTLLDSAIGLAAYHRDDELRQGIVEHFTFNLRRMVKMARGAGVRLILVTPASNLSHCSPFKSEHDSNLEAEKRSIWEDSYSRAQQQFSSGRLSESLAAVNQAVGIDGRHAGTLYLRAQILLALGDSEGASRDFAAARDEDVCPIRAPTEIIAAVRQVAAEWQIPLVDYVECVEKSSPRGIPGENLFLDHVHPTIEGYRDLSVLLISTMQDMGFLQTHNSIPQDVLASVTQRVMSRVDRAGHGRALRNASKVFSWAGKSDEADRLALQAIELIPDDADAEYQAANAFVRRGDIDEGIRRYQRVYELNPGYAANAHASLGFAFALKGDEQKAMEHYQIALELNPDFSDIHYNLATIFEKHGELDAAAGHYQSAIAGNPQHFFAQHRLGVVFARQTKWTQAVAQFNQALRLDPNSVDVHLHLGEVLARQGDVAAAREQFRWILRRFPEHSAALAELQRLGK